VARVSKKDTVTEPTDEVTSEKSEVTEARPIEIPHSSSVRQLAELLQISAIDIIKQLMRNGIMANINQVVNYEAAAAVAE